MGETFMATTANLQPLAQLFDKRQLITNPIELITYEVDAGFDRGRPDGVFYPQSAEEVSRVMQWASEHKIPLIARGAGTGLSGGAVPEHGGLIIEFARMNRILNFDQAGRAATVQTGVVNLVLDGVAKQAGLYYPPDPSSGRSSTIGGNLGENAGGPHCFKYGVTTNYITGLEVVLANGRILRLGGQALDYPEYDFVGALVGSEGTLGIVTQAEVRLLRNPPGVKTLMVSFASIEQAGQAVSAVIAAGLMPATLEMMDQKIMRMIEEYSGAGMPVDAEAGLIVEVDGYPASLDSQMEEIAEILTRHGGYDLRIAQSEEERQKIWYGRKSAAGAVARLAPSFYLVDITVPRSRLADMLTAVDDVCRHYDLRAGHVFHAGDGNLHPLILCDASNPELMARVFAACDEIVAHCLERGGSITGEHGVGIEKRKYMSAMYSGAELAAMLDLKALLDPQGLLNPGKIFPEQRPPVQRSTAAPLSGDQLAPTSTDEAAATLAAFSQARRPVRIGGSGPEADEAWLTTKNLSGVIEYAPNDLYITVGAGMPVQELQAFLAEHNMQAPLAAAWPHTTIGGLIATNTNAPLRMRYGALRDVLIATTVALPDGRVIRAGRNVVKNVAGYDLAKLFVGSYGTLGLICDVTLKVMPLPRQQTTLAVPVPDLAAGLAWAKALLPHLLVASGLVIVPGTETTPPQLLITVEGVPEDVATEIAELQACLQELGAPQATELAQSATASWADFIRQATDDTLLMRIGAPPAQLAQYAAEVSSVAKTRWFFDVANGLAYASTTPQSLAGATEWVDALRSPALAHMGYGLLVTLPAAYANDLNRWGYQSATHDLMVGLKQRWDPAGILNRGWV